MFDMLTTDQLFRLHDSLFHTGTRLHQRMMTDDGHARISVFGDEWAVLAAAHAEIAETQAAVGDELRRRRAEEVPMRISGCTCQAVAGSHASSCAWTMNRA